MLGTREHCELMESFEKAHRHYRLDKEPRVIWAKGNVYQNGELNALFRSYSQGYALAKSLYQIAPSKSVALSPLAWKAELMKVCIEIEVKDDLAKTIAMALSTVADEVLHAGYRPDAPDKAIPLHGPVIPFRVIQNEYRGG